MLPDTIPIMMYEITFFLKGIIPKVDNNEERSFMDLVITIPEKISPAREIICK